MVMPGDNVSLVIELITPVAMEKGLRFAIREGGHTVGRRNDQRDCAVARVARALLPARFLGAVGKRAGVPAPHRQERLASAASSFLPEMPEG